MDVTNSLSFLLAIVAALSAITALFISDELKDGGASAALVYAIRVTSIACVIGAYFAAPIMMGF